MSTILWSNNAQTTIAGSITNVATSVNLTPGAGVEFANPSAGQYFVGTFNDAATGLLFEIVHCTARASDTLTIVRGQEGTTPLSWNAGDIFGNFWTAGTAQALVQSGNIVSSIPLGANLYADGGNDLAALSGGFLNKFRNASCRVSSRGTSGSISSGTGAYTLDGHYLHATGATLSWQQAASVGYGANSLQLSCASGLSDAYWVQPIEGNEAAPLAGRVVVFQATINNNSGVAIAPTLTVKHLNSSDSGVAAPWTGGSPAGNTTDINAQALQTCGNGAKTTVSWSWTASSAFGNGAWISLDFGAGLNAASGNIQIGDFDIRLAPAAVAGGQSYVPIPEFRSLSVEQEVCYRFLPVWGSGGVSGSTFGLLGQCTSTTVGTIVWGFTTPTRVAPTGLTVSSASNFQVTDSGGGAHQPTGGISLSVSTIYAIEFAATIGTTSLVAGNATLFGTQNASALMYATGAEL